VPGDCAQGVFGTGLGSGAADTLIDADPVAAFSTEKAEDGKTGGLAGDVPEGVFDATDGGVDDRSAGKPGVRVQVLPDAGDVARVAPDKPGCEVGDHGSDGVIRADGIGFTDPGQALVGEDPAGNEVSVAHGDGQGLDAGDLHGVGGPSQRASCHVTTGSGCRVVRRGSRCDGKPGEEVRGNGVVKSPSDLHGTVRGVGDVGGWTEEEEGAIVLPASGEQHDF